MREITNATTEQLIKFTTFNGLYTDNLMHNLQNELKNEKASGKTKPYYRAYLNIVKRTAELINSLGIEDPFTKCSFFYYLLWLGIFSKDHTYAFTDKNRISNMSALGADIMLGKAACLNNSDMLSRILRATGTESYIIGCDVPDIKANPKIGAKATKEWQSITSKNQSSIKQSSLDLTALNFLDYGNHAISLFASKGMYYLADPTNLSFLSITDFLEATYVGEKTAAYLKPAVTLMLEDIDSKHFKDLVIKSFIYSDQPPLAADFIKYHSDLSKILLIQNVDLIDGFHKRNKPDIDIVCQTLK